MSPLASPKYAFKEALIRAAPEDAGVYVLYFGDTLLYIGMAKGPERQGDGRENPDTIRGRLLAHFHGELKPDLATHYRWEIHGDPELRVAELLDLLPKAPPYNLGR